MGLANCPRCGALFNKVTRDWCQKCIDAEEELLRETQHFLRENRKATVFEVMSEIGVERWQLDKWCNEKRINIVTPEETVAKRLCMYCNREIHEGTVCKTCMIKKKIDKKQESAPEQALDLEVDKEKRKKQGMYIKRIRQ